MNLAVPRPPTLRSRSTPVTTLHKLLTSEEATAATQTHPPPRGPILLKWADLEPWQRDNAFIRTHYRPASYSYSSSFQSLFYLHNETINIHTHLFGSILFFSIAVSLSIFHRSSVTTGDVLVFAVFFAGAVACLSVSCMYHAISNHSPSVARWGNQCDYVGIVALIVGSFVPSVYYGFFCERALMRGYWGMIISIGAGCTMVSINPKFRTPLWRPFRAAMFVAMGLSAVFPVLHGLSRYGLAHMYPAIGLRWLILQGILYVVGAAIYAARIPERFGPGQFDVFGSSHQIFHVLILLAAMSHLVGLLSAFHYSKTFSRCYGL